MDTDDDATAFMTMAVSKAEESLEDGEIPVGAIFVHESVAGKKQVIAAAANKTNVTKNGTRHAEMVAVDEILLDKKLGSDVFKRTDVYVTCEPCIMCAAALSRLGIRHVFFGCHNDRFGGNGSILSVNETPVGPRYSAYPADAGIMKTEAIAVFQRFYSRENKLCPEAKRRRKEDDDNESRLKVPPSSC